MDLQYLSFRDFNSLTIREVDKLPDSDEKQVQSVAEMLAKWHREPAETVRLRVYSLQVLKLKYCNLEDSHLVQAHLSQYSVI